MKFQRLLLTTVFSISLFTGISQSTATVKVLVSDFKNESKKGETILFENVNSKKVISGVSGEDGSFETQLPAGQTYLIKIKGISDTEDYTEMEVPALKEGQTMTFTVNVQFEPPKMYTLDRVHFQSGKATLTKDSYKELNNLLEYLQLKDDILVEIAGHTDDVGDDDDNLVLSQKRAEAVRNFLISKGISKDRVSAKGYGEKHPIASNENAEGRQKNRRTEVRIL